MFGEVGALLASCASFGPQVLRHDDVRRTRASVPQSSDLAARAVVGLAHLDGIDVDATHIILVDGRGLDRRWLPSVPTETRMGRAPTTRAVVASVVTCPQWRAPPELEKLDTATTCAMLR
jgi:hypothetical protein